MKKQKNIDKKSTDITQQVILSMKEQKERQPKGTKVQSRKKFLLNHITQLENEIENIELHLLNQQILNSKFQQKELENNTNREYLRELKIITKKRDKKISNSKKATMLVVEGVEEMFRKENERINLNFLKNAKLLTEMILKQFQEDFIKLSKTGNVDLSPIPSQNLKIKRKNENEK
ncbi:hypothetical protein M0813_12481 [Anaeramoeba flamelloides]|uniref:Uncharacterized protein n=1 Tax=Anaeramoeba flamelloides TaxID=1746091 RepID=A0ABQ8ZBN2_9EUKA|nr:hypothetical protein M0813_12481 [Anaeramoeba flamelloides]